MDKIIDQLSHPSAILFLIAYGLSMVMFHIKKRRVLLFTKFVSDLNYCAYYILTGGISGAMGAAVAATGGFIQAVTPDRHMAKTKKYRLAFAVFLALAGIHFSTQKTSDMLPLFAVIFARLAEISTSPQVIRIGMMLTFAPWMIYNFEHHFYLLFFANVTVFISLAWATWKHRRLKVMPEPV